ncbi:MAG: hypothetical protein AAFV88_22320, partial [Planctomycetota bacterium]
MFRIAFFVGLLFMVTTACRRAETTAPNIDSAAAPQAAGTVRVIVNLPEGDPIEQEVDEVAAGTTVETVMRALDVPIEITGSGTTAVTSG